MNLIQDPPSTEVVWHEANVIGSLLGSLSFEITSIYLVSFLYVDEVSSTATGGYC